MIVSCLGGVAHAASLADRLNVLITDNSYFFQGANFDSLTPAIERIAVQGTNLPAVSTAPSFTYVYEPELGTFVRSSGSLGPVFLERADTVGRHRALVGLSYLHADLTNLNGHDAASQLFFINSAPGLEANDRGVKNRFQFEDFALRVNSLELSATYGLTDAWDLNVLFPLLETTLDTEATTQNSTVHLDGTVAVDPARTVSLHASSFGVGDLLVRSKYRFGQLAGAPVAAELILRAPTGREGDFQGLGDWTVTPLFVISRAIRANDVHGNVGMEFNADNIDRSRVRYGAGVTLRLIERVALLIDVIGSSGIATDNFSQVGVALPGSRFDGPFQTHIAVAEPSSVLHIDSAVPRTDVVDLAVGFKLALPGRGIAFLEAIVPLTQDGLRADVVPTGGVEYTF